MERQPPVAAPPPRSVRVPQDPDLLRNFRRSITATFEAYYGHKIPTSTVLRALESAFVRLEDQVLEQLPTPALRGGRSKLPNQADREYWMRLEHDLEKYLVAAYSHHVVSGAKRQPMPRAM